MGKTNDSKMAANVAALVRALKFGNYGTQFGHAVYTEAERVGAIRYVSGEGYRAA